VPLVVLLVGAGAWLLAAGALQPIARLTGAVERVTARGLDQRIRVLPRDQEIQRLITMFNQMKQAGSPVSYSLESGPRVEADIATLASGSVTIREDTGGAHGASRFQVINRVHSGSSARVLTLADVVARGTNSVAVCSRAIHNQFKQAPEPLNSSAATFKKLTAEQARRFVVSREGLTFLLDQGELSAEALGAVRLFVPFESLKGRQPERCVEAAFRDAADTANAAADGEVGAQPCRV
jgi:methyl-accepting chemotaxis protein